MKRLVPSILCVGVFLTSVLLVTLSPSSSQVTSDKYPRPEIDFSQFPIADLNSPEPTDAATRLKRAKKSKKYNDKFQPEISEFSGVTFRVNDQLSNLPALPIQQSSVVLLGTVTSSTAHLSEDKRSVYSEFEVQIETTFKNTSKQALNSDDSIIVERFGGRVRLPSGSSS
jgi:hypothetical protein